MVWGQQLPSNVYTSMKRTKPPAQVLLPTVFCQEYSLKANMVWGHGLLDFIFTLIGYFFPFQSESRHLKVGQGDTPGRDNCKELIKVTVRMELRPRTQ